MTAYTDAGVDYSVWSPDGKFLVVKQDHLGSSTLATAEFNMTDLFGIHGRDLSGTITTASRVSRHWRGSGRVPLHFSGLAKERPGNPDAAIATTSAGLALSLGRRDSAMGLTRVQVLENARSIVCATELPVSADLEEGFGISPEACVETVIAASATGIVGGSIEDATGDPNKPIFDFGTAVERIAAVCDTAAGLPFLVTAGAENFLCGRPDLDDTINRLQAFSKAGTDVLYAPGPKEPETPVRRI